MKRIILFTFLLCANYMVFAGGYRVALQGNKQLAMGHTGVAVLNSAETVFFNPAGMAFLNNRFSASVGANFIFSNISFQNTEFGWSSEADNPVSTPFNAYVAYQVNDWLSVGLGAYTPYGSSVEYPENWEGSHLIQKIELASIFIQPTVAIKLHDKMSIGGGPIFVTGNVNFNRNLDRSLSDLEGNRSNVTIDKSGINAWGYSLGMLFRPTEKWNIGVNYRSEIEMDAENGSADFQNVPSGLQGQFADGTFNASLPLPAELTVGTSYQINDKWLVAFDFNRVYWDSYDSLNLSFSNGLQSTNPRNYKNSSTYRFGVQYVANDQFTLRGGYYFDESPVQEGYFAPETPRNDSDNFTGGLTFNVNSRFAIDASFLYIHFEEVDASYDYHPESNGQTSSFGGTYKNNAFIPGLSVSYKF
ncbi:long-chain fatty acid transport protein [Zhouia amylolytica]|uniref:Long-chain fatty acid transport protein n=1 Tax=Zhouia amylolytica TaxID=376730 RepID=A0A1I6REM3_9FLAO|nr:outer membrane protein transport protein [Zhouia amylolytica]MCQ0110650.1 outer membrane protein transport protein [Zhouia amylolytica]SFS63153.1 long-chain fatty acid transport protein [Zhouia amylolytica]